MSAFSDFLTFSSADSTPPLKTVDFCHFPELSHCYSLWFEERDRENRGGLPDVHEMFRLLIAQEAIDVDDQRISGEDVNVVVVLSTL